MTNAAYDALIRLCDMWNRREHAGPMMAPTFIRVDRRPVIGMPDSDRDGMADVEQSMWDLDAHWPSAGDVIAHHGERLALTAGRVLFDDGGMRLDLLVFCSIDAEGLVDRLVLYEPEQRVEAESEFAELAAAIG